MFLMSIMMVSYIFIRFQSKIIKVYEKHAFFYEFLSAGLYSTSFRENRAIPLMNCVN